MVFWFYKPFSHFKSRKKALPQKAIIFFENNYGYYKFKNYLCTKLKVGSKF